MSVFFPHFFGAQQAIARCHRIGQTAEVKIYRLITRGTYEQEMFTRASLKLGLDAAVLQSMAVVANTDGSSKAKPAMTSKEIEKLLRQGAYAAFTEDDDAGISQFEADDIEKILSRSTTIKYDESGASDGKSSFSKAAFVSNVRDDVDMADPNFWSKIGVHQEALPVDHTEFTYKRIRKTVLSPTRLKRPQVKDVLSSDSDDDAGNSSAASDASSGQDDSEEDGDEASDQDSDGGGRRKRGKATKPRGPTLDDTATQPTLWTARRRDVVLNALKVLPYGQWQAMQNALRDSDAKKSSSSGALEDGSCIKQLVLGFVAHAAAATSANANSIRFLLEVIRPDVIEVLAGLADATLSTFELMSRLPIDPCLRTAHMNHVASSSKPILVALDRMAAISILVAIASANANPFEGVVASTASPADWWNADVHDSDLLRGILRHGLDWDAVADDPLLSFAQLSDEQDMPAPSHLQRRFVSLAAAAMVLLKKSGHAGSTVVVRRRRQNTGPTELTTKDKKAIEKALSQIRVVADWPTDGDGASRWTAFASVAKCDKALDLVANHARAALLKAEQLRSDAVTADAQDDANVLLATKTAARSIFERQELFSQIDAIGDISGDTDVLDTQLRNFFANIETKGLPQWIAGADDRALLTGARAFGFGNWSQYRTLGLFRPAQNMESAHEPSSSSSSSSASSASSPPQVFVFPKDSALEVRLHLIVSAMHAIKAEPNRYLHAAAASKVHYIMSWFLPELYCENFL